MNKKEYPDKRSKYYLIRKIAKLQLELRVAKAKLAILEIRSNPKEMKKVERMINYKSQKRGNMHQ